MKVTRNSFEQAFASNGYKCPTYENYADFNLCIEKAGIQNIKEAEIFLAHVIHETGGLRYLNERLWLENGGGSIELLDLRQDSKTEEYKEKYNNRTKQSKAGKYYFGRGWLHLSGNDNYKACSDYFSQFNCILVELPTNHLLDNPELVSSDHHLSWGTAAWFWKTQVKPQVSVESMSVKSTLRVINGVVENDEQAQNRVKIYNNINLQLFQEFSLCMVC